MHGDDGGLDYLEIIARSLGGDIDNEDGISVTRKRMMTNVMMMMMMIVIGKKAMPRRLIPLGNTRL